MGQVAHTWQGHVKVERQGTLSGCVHGIALEISATDSGRRAPTCAQVGCKYACGIFYEVTWWVEVRWS